MIDQYHALDIQHIHQLTYIQVEDQIAENDNTADNLKDLSICNTSVPIDSNTIKGNVSKSDETANGFATGRKVGSLKSDGLENEVKDVLDTATTVQKINHGHEILDEVDRGRQADIEKKDVPRASIEKVNTLGGDIADRKEDKKAVNEAENGIEDEPYNDEYAPQSHQKPQKFLGLQSAIAQDGLTNFASKRNSQLNIDQNEAYNPLVVMHSDRNLGVQKDMHNKETKIETNFYFPPLERRDALGAEGEHCEETTTTTTPCPSTTTPCDTTTTTTTTTPCPTTTTTTECPTTTTTTTTTTTPCPTTTTTTPCPTTTTTTPCPTTTTTTPYPTTTTTTCSTTTTTTPCPPSTETTPCHDANPADAETGKSGGSGGVMSYFG